MRILIAVTTLVCVVALTAEADVPRKEDVPKNINLLKTSTSAKVRATAAEELGRRGAIRASDVAEAIDPLLKALKDDKDADVRKACAAALGEIGTEAEKVVPALTEALMDSSATVKLAAIQSLGQYASEAKSALPQLRDIAKAKDDKKLSQAAAAAAKSISGNTGKKGG
jgi:HEAT repeat protein